MLFAPAARLDIASVAVPDTLRLTVPSSEAPLQAGVSGVTLGCVIHLARGPNAICLIGFTTPPSSTPRQNSTLPSDTPVGVGVTVAVSVTVWPADAGLGEAVTVVAVVVSAAVPVPETGTLCMPAVANTLSALSLSVNTTSAS